MTAPDMVSVIAAVLAEHVPGDTLGHYADGGVFEGEILCSCGHVTKYTGELDFDDKAHAAHQARAVLAAISEALGTDWGMRTPLGMHYDYASEEEARRLAGQNRCDVVTRLAAGPWTAVEG